MKLNFPWQKIQLINAAKEFAALRLWDEYDNLDFFVVETPLEDPVVGCIMGAGMQEFGLCIFRGPDAFQQPFLLNQGKDALAKKGNTLGFSMEYYRDMHHEEKKWYKACNYRTRKNDWLPAFIILQPGKFVEMPEKDHDIKLLLHVVKGTIIAHNNGQFRPLTIANTGSKMLTIQTSGTAEKPTVQVTQKAFAGSKELLAFCNKEEMFEELVPPDISKLPRLDQTWVLVTGYMSIHDEADDVCALAVAEEKSGYILHADVIEMDPALVLDSLVAVFAGDNASESVGVPEEIIVADKELFKAVSGQLKGLGLKVRCQVDHPAAADIRHSLKHDLPALLDKHPVKPLEEPQVDLSVVPDADDLKGWKAVSQAQTNRFINFWNNSDNLRKDRPSNQFFGDSDWDYYLEEYRNLLVLPSYVTWSALCYRARKKDATHVEKLLAGELPQALRIILEAMNNAYPSLYQIDQTDPKAGTLVLKDLLLGESVTVHDYGFSESANPGIIMPLWVTKAGSFHFIDIAGPVFGAMEAMNVLEELRDLKLPAKPTASWLRENAHIFGQLWQFYDDTQEIREKGPELKNTDGDTLEFITAQFGYSDLQAVRRALERCDDIDYDDTDDTFIWFKESGNNDPMGNRTLLGRIFFEDGFVKAEVNSKKRLKQLTKLLEKIGLVYHKHESKSVEHMMKQDREAITKENLPEEVKEYAREQITQHYMDWLDMPIPHLNNKTPRQAAKTAKGAQKVRMLIQTIPTPCGSADIKVPKDRMLRELGLEDKL